MIDPHEIFGDEGDEWDDELICMQDCDEDDEYLYEDDQWEDDETNNENPCY